MLYDDIKASDLSKQASRHTDKQLSRVCANWVNCCSTEGKNEPITDLVIVHVIFHPRNLRQTSFYPRVYRLHVDLEVRLII